MAPRANWKGFLKLSLVSCPVALFPASSSASRISFNTLSRKSGAKVKRIYVDPATNEEVDTEDQVKGYAVGRNVYLLVEDEELDAIQIESTHTIEIESFVPREEIDPRYIEAPYYLAPDDRVGQEAFVVIREAMRDSGKVALGRVVIARRERIVMIEPRGKGLMATTLRYAYEVRDDTAYFEDIPDIAVGGETKELADLIVARRSGHFDPARFEDRYENALVAMIKNKQEGLPVAQPAAPRPHNVVNLMDALKRSLAAEKERADTMPEAIAPKPLLGSRRRRTADLADSDAIETKGAGSSGKPRKTRSR